MGGEIHLDNNGQHCRILFVMMSLSANRRYLVDVNSNFYVISPCNPVLVRIILLSSTVRDYEYRTVIQYETGAVLYVPTVTRSYSYEYQPAYLAPHLQCTCLPTCLPTCRPAYLPTVPTVPICLPISMAQYLRYLPHLPVNPRVLYEYSGTCWLLYCTAAAYRVTAL